jgi:hypothetical protein
MEKEDNTRAGYRSEGLGPLIVSMQSPQHSTPLAPISRMQLRQLQYRRRSTIRTTASFHTILGASGGSVHEYALAERLGKDCTLDMGLIAL